MSECIYCGSTSYGKDCCLYSPTKAHMHMDEPDKCIYCGSSNTGQGCLYNPYGDLHVKGFAIYQNVKEQLKKSAVLTHLFECLSVKNVKSYNSPLDRMYKRMGNSLQKEIVPLLDSFALQDFPILEKMDEDFSYLQSRINEQVADLRKTIKHANCAYPTEIVEKLLASAIISSNPKL